MTSIPASLFVATNPSVVAAGGSDLVLNGMFLTNSTRVPIGTVQSFSLADSVGDYFGAGSEEAQLAVNYFNSWDGSTLKPGSILFTQYNPSAVAAYLRGGNISALALSALQAINGTLSVTTDGYPISGTVNLSSATSFSAAAGIIQTALNSALPTECSFTAAIAGTTMTVSAVVTGTLAVGQTVLGAGVTVGTIITALGTGTGGAGTYTVNNSQSVASESMTTQPTPVAVSFDSQSGAFIVSSGITGAASSMSFATGTAAASLLLTAATGAVTSQGAAAAVPGTFMDALTNITQNWASFLTTFNPDVSGNANKLLFAQWANSKNNRYVYICGDTDVTAAASVPASSSLGQILHAAGDTATSLWWDPSDPRPLCAFIAGSIASIDFGAPNGRITFAYKAQSGLVPGVTSASQAVALGGNPQVPGDFGNYYNYYGAIATANQGFELAQRGQVSGPFAWLDGLVDAIWLTNLFQVTLMEFLAQATSVPFGTAGNTQIKTALQDDINQGLTFGAYGPGTLTSSQVAEVNARAGGDVASTLATRGWYLAVLPSAPSLRASRGPVQLIFFYLDRGSIQSIALSTVALQ